MKRLFLCLTAIVWAGAVMAQSGERMVIEYNNGAHRSAIDITNIRRVTFENDSTELEPDDQQLADRLFMAYPDMSYGWLCELLSDNVIDLHAPHLPASPTDVQNYVTQPETTPYNDNDVALFGFDYNNTGDGNDTPQSLWEGCYQAINTANEVIAQLQAMDENWKQQYGTSESLMGISEHAVMGEALLCRAYCHFVLANVFAPAYRDEQLSRNDQGVPYLTEPTASLPDVATARPTLTQTYEQIESDLTEGMQLLGYICFSRQPKYHFTPESAHAFAARFYLFKRDYAKVVEHANAVLGTHRDQLPSKLLNYAQFNGVQTINDLALLWQSPASANNLLLMDTYSLQFRHSLNHRFGHAGLALRDIAWHQAPMWKPYLLLPAFIVGGAFGNTQASIVSGKIAETFEYTDRVAGIGYVHLIRTEFTASELLLERAEAHLLMGDAGECLADLAAYEQSRQSFLDGQSGINKNYLSPLTQDIIDSHYQDSSKSNCFADWNFTANLSPSFVVSAGQVPYMNCINDMRRYETAYTGRRFFDLKRWGIEYSHVMGADSLEIVLSWDDSRRAVTPPTIEAVAAAQKNRLERRSQGKTVEAAEIGRQATLLPKESLLSR